MPRYIAFLRAINVGGARTVKMSVLRQVFESLGYSQVATFIASGNVVFEATDTSAKALESKIENKLQESLGYRVEAFVRTEAQLVEISNHRTFPQSKIESAAQFNIIFLADALDDRAKNRLMALQTDTDEFRVHGREIYWLRRRKQGRLDYATPPLEKALDQPFTIRGAKTIEAMAEKYCSSSL